MESAWLSIWEFFWRSIIFWPVPVESDTANKSSRAFWFGGILTCLVLMAAGVFLGQIMPAADYPTSELVAEAKQEALNVVNDLRYRKGKINSLPDGQLKKCGAWTASDETALKVTMKDPESLSLRGFTGSVYDGSFWKSIDTEDAYKQKNLFYSVSSRMDSTEKHS